VLISRIPPLKALSLAEESTLLLPNLGPSDFSLPRQRTSSACLHVLGDVFIHSIHPQLKSFRCGGGGHCGIGANVTGCRSRAMAEEDRCVSSSVFSSALRLVTSLPKYGNTKCKHYAVAL
jgi:hypothetical protein